MRSVVWHVKFLTTGCIVYCGFIIIIHCNNIFTYSRAKDLLSDKHKRALFIFDKILTPSLIKLLIAVDVFCSNIFHFSSRLMFST